MSFTHQAFTRVVERSGLKKHEIALLYSGISRQTVYCWLRGKLPKAGSLLSRTAESITAVLLAAIKAKTLPMPDSNSEVRKQRIERMRVRLEQLPAAPR